MTIEVTGIYSDITVTDQESICFPPNFAGSIRPGSMDHLVLAESIEWGVSMSEPIEPGVIPKCCKRLLLPAGYKHSIDDIKLEAHVDVFVNHRNIGRAPTDRVFTVWKEDSQFTPKLPREFKWSGSGLWFDSPFFGRKRVQCATKIYYGFRGDEFERLIESSKQICEASPNLYIDSLARKIRDKVTALAQMGVLAKGLSFQIKCHTDPASCASIRIRLQELFPQLSIRIDSYRWATVTVL